MKTTQDEKRILIAQACGWKFHPPTAHLYSEHEKSKAIMCWVRPGNDYWQMECVPDYFNDLNAIVSEARKLPNDGTSLRFIETLAVIQTDYHPFFSTAEFFSTAAEWSEAFGLTLNLWTA